MGIREIFKEQEVHEMSKKYIVRVSLEDARFEGREAKNIYP